MKKGDSEMTKKLDFVEIAMNAFRFIENKETVLDVDLMIRLGFSPPAWKVWRPQLIQKLTNITLPKFEQEKDDETKIKIAYDKKKTLWTATEVLEVYN